MAGAPVEAPNPGGAGRLLRAVFNYGVGSYLPQLINFALVPLYSHYIPPDEMGALEVCLTAQTLVAILARLGMAGSVTRFYFDEREGPGLRDMVTTVALTMVVAAAAFVGLGLLVGPSLFARFLPDIPFHPYIDLALVAAFFQAAPDLQRRLLQAREQSAYSAKLSVAMGFLGTVSSVVAVVVLGLGAAGVMWAGLLVAIVFAFVAWFRHREDLRGRFSWPLLRRALDYGLPLVPHHGAAWVQQFVGRWVLGSICTAAAVGHLGIASRVASPLAIATGAFGTAYAPIYFSWRTDLGADEAHEHTRRVGIVVVLVGAIAVLGAGTYGSFVVRHLMAESYVEAAVVVPVVASALAMHLYYTLLTNEIFFIGNTKWISIIFVCAAAVNIAGITLFGARGQALAAAGAQVAGGVMSCVLAAMMAGKTAKLPLDVRATIVAVLAMGAGCVVPHFSTGLSAAADLGVTSAAFLVLSALTLVMTGRIRSLVATIRELRTARRAKRKRAAVEPAD
jgi:O-antigen/teichoic acid export membrane protein